MDSAREVLSSMGAPVDFEEMYLSEVEINQTFKHGCAQCLVLTLCRKPYINIIYFLSPC